MLAGRTYFDYTSVDNFELGSRVTTTNGYYGVPANEVYDKTINSSIDGNEFYHEINLRWYWTLNRTQLIFLIEDDKTNSDSI